MTLTAKVKNHSIPLPPDLQIEEGTEVRIVLPETDCPADNAAKNRHGWLMDFAGVAKELPEDFAAQHDHYIHRTPKRGSE